MCGIFAAFGVKGERSANRCDKPEALSKGRGRPPAAALRLAALRALRLRPKLPAADSEAHRRKAILKLVKRIGRGRGALPPCRCAACP